MLGVSIGDAPAALRAAVLAMKRADAEVRRAVIRRTRGEFGPAWKAELTKRASAAGPMGSRVIPAGARLAAGNPPQIVTASSKRGLGEHKGVVPDTNWPGYEYGANRNKIGAVVRKGSKFKRHTQRQLKARARNGRVIGPAVQDLLPRISAYWTQSVVKAFMDAAEGKN